MDDTNARLSSGKGSFRETKKIKGLFPFSSQSHRRYYPQQDVVAGPSQMNETMADPLVSSVDATGRKDVVFSAAGAKDMELVSWYLGSVVS